MTTAELEPATMSTATLGTSTTMNALVYHGPGKRSWEDKPRPYDPGSERCHCADYHFDDLRYARDDILETAEELSGHKRVPVPLSAASPR